MKNALSIDVEDYFQVNAFSDRIQVAEWDSFEHRVEKNTQKLLQLLDNYNVKSTFFILGWVAERFPNLVKEIHQLGHEVASHGYNHQLVFKIGKEKFREDISSSKKLLEDITGAPVLGYRAPTYSITNKSLWAIDILVEEGYKYDSSIFPIIHDTYGIPGAQRFPYMAKGESLSIKEFPISTKHFSLLGKSTNFPVAGGGYLRLFPVKLLAKWLKSINKNENEPFVIYLHPWEVDPEQPKLEGSAKSRFRHYVNLNKMYGKLEYLLQEFEFTTINSIIDIYPFSEDKSQLKPNEIVEVS